VRERLSRVPAVSLPRAKTPVAEQLLRFPSQVATAQGGGAAGQPAKRTAGERSHTPPQARPEPLVEQPASQHLLEVKFPSSSFPPSQHQAD